MLPLEGWSEIDTWARLWRDHNGHRHVLAKALLTLEAKTGQMWILPILAVLMSLASFLFLAQSCNENWIPRKERWLLTILCALFIWGPHQKSNWTIGIYSVWPATLLGAILFSYGLASRRMLTSWFGFALLYLSSLAWIAVVPVFVWHLLQRTPQSRLRTWAPQLAALWLLGALYFWGRTPSGESTASLMRAPGHLIQILGAPWQWLDEQLAWALGFTGLLASVIAWKFLRREPLGGSWQQQRFTITLSLVCGTALALIGAGRAGLWNWSDAVPDRYFVLAAPLWFFLARETVLWSDRNRGRTSAPTVLAAWYGVVLLLIITNAKTMRHEIGLQRQQHAAHRCLYRLVPDFSETMSEADQNCLRVLYPHPTELVQVARKLYDLGQLPKPVDATP